MAISDQHPLYAKYLPHWVQMRDTYEGEPKVKEQGYNYLPPTSGMVEDGAYSANTSSQGRQAYDAYRKRARFPDWVREAVKALLGVMHHKPPVIELPSVMEPMREIATARNESLEVLLRRINEQQLAIGRLGLLGDIISSPHPRAGQPYVSVYTAESAINWDDAQIGAADLQALNLVVLNESAPRRVKNDFSWEERIRYRVLMLGDFGENEPVGAYSYGVFDDSHEFSLGMMETPVAIGSALDEIPFVFINSQDIAPEPDVPPLLGLSNLSLGIYRGEADYRQSLFMQGQDTLVIIGSLLDETSPDDPVRVGAHARLNLQLGGDARYKGVDSSGLPEQRMALENDHARAQSMAGQLLDSVSREKESGEALRVRVAARTATLNQIAMAGAYGLQSILRKLARWIGADPEQVIVTPNLDFVDDQMTGKELAEWMGAKVMGAPVSMRTIHRIMEEKGATELDLEEELAELEREQETELAQRNANAGSTNQDGPEDDEEQVEEEEEEQVA